MDCSKEIRFVLVSQPSRPPRLPQFLDVAARLPFSLWRSLPLPIEVSDLPLPWRFPGDPWDGWVAVLGQWCGFVDVGVEGCLVGFCWFFQPLLLLNNGVTRLVLLLLAASSRVLKPSVVFRFGGSVDFCLSIFGGRPEMFEAGSRPPVVVSPILA